MQRFKRAGLILLLALVVVPACTEDAQNNVNDKKIKGKADIIGDDDRRDEFSKDVSENLRALARSTAMVIENASISDNGDGTVTLASTPLSDSYFMCPDEVFASQPVSGMCSAWLVAPDTMMTNGHCITSQADCEQKSFVFDFAIDKEGSDPTVNVSSKQVVACDKVLAWDNTNFCDVDFAVIKLKEPITDRTPVKVRGPNDKLKGDDLVIIGHPFGLPRKYALQGNVIENGDNGFTTTHDIFGGNSGSAIFDAESGTVQGLIACGGSNIQWEAWSGKWSLDRKTGQSCDQSCDGNGEFTDGMEESASVCASGDTRKRCVCDDSGQLVWEKRTCLSFEAETDGQCTREQRVSTFTCETSPWLCATPYAQHSNIFAMYVDAWDVHESKEIKTVSAGESLTQSILVDATGAIQTTSISVKFKPFDESFFASEFDVNMTLVKGEGDDAVSIDLVRDGIVRDGTSHSLSNNAQSDTQVFMVPFIVNDFNELDAAGKYTLVIENIGVEDLVLEQWSVNQIVKPEASAVLFTEPCVGDCKSTTKGWPDPLHEPFDGESKESTNMLVSGTLDTDWTVDVLDTEGTGYEVFKTRKSQTMSMSVGEFALVRTFNEDIGGRDVTIDFRYDGDGWFQVWADDQIIYTETSFAQKQVTFPIPVNARSLKFVLGATDNAQDHELTLFDLMLSPPKQQDAPQTMTSCFDGEVQFTDVNQEGYCLTSGCMSDADCMDGGVCTTDETQGVNVCAKVCADDTECTDGLLCVPALPDASLCASR